MLARFRAMDQIGAHVQGVFRTLEAFVSFFAPLRSASRVGYSGPCDNQVITKHREIAPLLGSPRLPWMSDKPCRIVVGIVGS